MEARLATSVLASALMRRAEAEGGFAMVIAKGDATAGAMLVVVEERGADSLVLERILRPDGRYEWQNVGIDAARNAESLQKFLSRRREFDPDLWIIELTVASAERFAAEMNAPV